MLATTAMTRKAQGMGYPTLKVLKNSLKPSYTPNPLLMVSRAGLHINATEVTNSETVVSDFCQAVRNYQFKPIR